MIRHIRILVKGVVQGVGFRPFLHRCAKEYHLTGWARNTGFGVEMEVEGEADALDSLCGILHSGIGLPPLAVIESVEIRELTAGTEGKEDAFRILSSSAGGRETLVAPDIATCPDCRRELFSPANRRYRYPFINCTNCGPRFTIVRDVPYDRQLTSMAEFAMCEDCEKEYGDIEDRRYHAQPDCCPVCGPEVRFAAVPGDTAGEGTRTKRGYRADNSFYIDENGVVGEEAFRKAKQLLDAGGILAIKGLGGFHLACRIDSREVVQRLRDSKQRPRRPLAIMAADLSAAQIIGEINKREEEALVSSRRPIVLVKKKDPEDYSYLSLTDRIGIMLPYTPLHELLFAPLEDGTGAIDALVMTSANLSERPVIIDDREALTELSGIADAFLIHDRMIQRRCDDSLLSVENEGKIFYRRSRGYAPEPVPLAFSVDGLLAMGAEQKACFAFGKSDRAFYSQHIGDLKNAETLAFYEEQQNSFQKLFGCRVDKLICDLHPDYLSTAAAKEKSRRLGIPLISVQHHHAHMASCMADNRLESECIGLVWDGTGLGNDGEIWGSETFAGSYEHVQRLASLDAIPLIGGDTAIREIGRIALALMEESRKHLKDKPAEESPAFDGPEQSKDRNRSCKRADLAENARDTAGEAKKQLLLFMLQSDINCFRSHGMGRLFDGVYSLLTGEEQAGYEGEAAALLESLALQSPGEKGCYHLPLSNGKGDYRPMIAELLQDTAELSVRAMRFHNTLVRFAADCCSYARESTGLTRVVLSGGVFFNRILLAGITENLRKDGFEVYTHHRVSPGDEGIALGQLAIGAHTGKEG